MLEESKKVNSAGKIDQLDALRFKTQMASKNLSGGNRANSRERNSWYEGRNSEGGNVTNTATPIGKLKLKPMASLVALCEFHMRIYMRANP